MPDALRQLLAFGLAGVAGLLADVALLYLAPSTWRSTRSSCLPPRAPPGCRWRRWHAARWPAWASTSSAPNCWCFALEPSDADHVPSLPLVAPVAISRPVGRRAPLRLAGAFVLLLALAGCAGPGFLSEIGDTLGHNLTALFMLGVLALLVRRWERAAWPVLAGLGTGLKLTNAVYALALCLVLLAHGDSLWRRVRAAWVFGVAVLAGIGVSAGYWYWTMWSTFGNPLFPQFNNIFKAPLAAPVGIGDTGWLPKGLVEKLLWPFIFTLHPARVIEIPLRQLIWPALYLLFIAALLRLALRPSPGPAALAGDAAERDARAPPVDLLRRRLPDLAEFIRHIPLPGARGIAGAVREVAARITARIAARLDAACATLDRYGLAMERSGCRAYDAYIGRQLNMYQLCIVWGKAM